MPEKRSRIAGQTGRCQPAMAGGRVVVRSQAGVSKMPAAHALSGIPRKIEVFGPLAIPNL
ncbi:MAG: hypothetical protein AB1461_19370 [Thermodesulfobacteriota bacterium]